MSDVLRTPEERFKDLADFPYEPPDLDDLAGYDNLRMHYVDEGPQAAGAELPRRSSEWLRTAWAGDSVIFLVQPI